jgi:hypothetical protein
VLLGQLSTFFNPILDVPYALMEERLPARVIGFGLGMVHGLNVLPLLAIGWTLLAIANPGRRFAAAAGLALAGVTGAGGLSEIGTVFYDNVVSLGIFTAVLVVVARWDELVDAPKPHAALWAMAAGLPSGLAFGLKQPDVVFCVGLCAAFLVADMPPPRRVWVAFWFGIGVLLGAAAGGGPWMLHLWRSYGNPLFPFFNHLFRSPWALPLPYRDDGYVPHGLLDKLSFAYRFAAQPRLTAEIVFRDFRLPVLVTLVPLAMLAGLARKLVHARQANPLTRPGPTGWLLAAGLATYATWVSMFAIYRYLIPLEMLAPLMVAAAIGLLPLGRALRPWAAVAVVAALVATTATASWIRVPWQDKAVAVSLPPIDRPAETLVLMSGHEPMSFLVPSFPRSMRFLRIDSTFTLPDDPQSGFGKLFRETIEGHSGPIASLHFVNEEGEVAKKLAAYGLELDRASCHDVTSPIGAAAYAYCLTRRR